MSRLSKSIRVATSLSVLTFGGCHSAFNGAKDAWSVQSAHPITVQTRLVAQNIQIGKGASELSADDRDRVAVLGSDYRARGAGRLSIAAPEGAAGDQAAMQLATQMTNIVLDQGVDAANVEINGYRPAAGQSDAPIVLSYSIYEATPSACGNWTNSYSFAPLNHDTPDHGCATQNNLAAMVENPRDLVAARNEQPVDQARRAFVLDQYRKGQITSSQKDDQATGTVSEVDK